MRWDSPAGPLWLSVISHARPQTVPGLEAQLPAVTWYVGAEDAVGYRAAGAAAVVASGGLCASRNAALRDGWAAGCAVAELSDDLQGLQQARGPMRAACQALLLTSALTQMAQRLTASPYRLAGVAPTANPFYFAPTRPVTTTGFCVGDLLLVAPCDLYFDAALRLKEDYDYTLQHLARYGGVVRSNDILATFAHRTNAGGAVAVRTPALEAASIGYLRQKWGAAVRPHPRRPYEVVLRWAAPVAAGGSG